VRYISIKGKYSQNLCVWDQEQDQIVDTKIETMPNRLISLLASHSKGALIVASEINKQEGLAVASIAWDDRSTLPSDDPFSRTHWTINCSVLMPACTVTAMRGKLGSNLKPKLAIMCQCTPSQTYRQTDGHWHRSISARCIYYISC